MITEQYIVDFVNNHDYDIRISRNGRFMDQKCIPDVVNAVSECVLEYIGDNLQKKFSKDDIWHFEYSRRLIEEVFSKPDSENSMMRAEYDKFFAQPLKLLSYASVLKEEKINGVNMYQIRDKEIMEYIAMREKNAITFLFHYLSKVMKDSCCYEYFEEFFERQDNSSFQRLRGALINFYHTYTPIKGNYEPPRIFNKIINILAFKLRKKGCDRGFISSSPLTIEAIRYNRLNWRDIEKPKSQSRQEYATFVNEAIGDNSAYYERSVEKAKKFVREMEPYSEVHRFIPYKTTDAHHIFMKSEFPELADMPENIIALTGTQHYSYAHPNHKTSVVDTDYQMICLISKLDSIERNFQQGIEGYSLEDFTKVLNKGLNTDEFSETLGYENIKARLLHYLRPPVAI